MKVFSLKINKKTFKVALVSSDKDMKAGLSGKPQLKEGHGMLFYFGNEQEVTMNMGGMKYPIDMVFINDNDEVVKVATMQEDSKDITVKDVLFVLEVNSGEAEGLEGEEVIHIQNLSNIVVKRQGGTIDMIEEDVSHKKDHMQVLDDAGVILMNLKGGERIFSIKHTKALVELAKKIDKGEAKEEELGKLMIKIIKIQDTQKPQYVD